MCCWFVSILQMVRHGGCLGLGLAAMGTARQDVYEQLKFNLYEDDAVTGKHCVNIPDQFGSSVRKTSFESRVSKQFGYCLTNLDTFKLQLSSNEKRANNKVRAQYFFFKSGHSQINLIMKWEIVISCIFLFNPRKEFYSSLCNWVVNTDAIFLQEFLSQV